MIKSNIGIASNIYIRSNPDIRRDIKYTEKITGAKLLNDISRRYIGLEAIPFSSVQQEFVSGNQICSFAKNGEMSFGPVMVDGNLRWVSRCEYASCPGSDGCVPHEITRETIFQDDTEDKKACRSSLKRLNNHTR